MAVPSWCLLGRLLCDEDRARALLDEVNAYNQRRRQSVGRAEREFLETREREAEQGLKNAEDDLAGFFRHNRRFQDSPGLVAEEARLQRQVSLRQQLYVALTAQGRGRKGTHSLILALAALSSVDWEARNATTPT